MTTFTQRHEVALVVRATVCQRQDVMHLLRRRQPSLSLALLTQRMLQQKTRTDLLPRAAVTFVGVGIAEVVVVLMLRNLPVLVTESAIGQSSAARVGARSLGFVWHPVPPSMKKDPRVFAKVPDPSFAIVLSHNGQHDKQ